MAIKIDQELLCTYCAEDRFSCDGCNCDQARYDYLEEHGISETKKTFADLKINDKIYLTRDDLPVPLLEVKKINSMSQLNKDCLSIHYDSTSVKVEDESKSSLTSYPGWAVFLDRKEAEEALEKLCTERIVALAKVIGGLGK